MSDLPRQNPIEVFTWLIVMIAALTYTFRGCDVIRSRDVDIIRKAGSCFAVFTNLGTAVVVPCPPSEAK